MMTAHRKTYTYDYPRPAVTVDLVIVTQATPRQVLLIRRKNEPFAGKWALPGGFLDMDESLEDAARRELREETGVEVESLDQLRAFGAPDRDPRGRVVSIAFIAEVDAEQLHPSAADDAAEARWHPLSKLPTLAFDHTEILACAARRLKE